MNISPILNHENVIKCYGYYRTTRPPRKIGVNGGNMSYSGHLVFVMEKADCDLRKYLTEHRDDLSYEDRKQLIIQIVTGLVYLYNQHITLHDIKVCYTINTSTL